MIRLRNAHKFPASPLAVSLGLPPETPLNVAIMVAGHVQGINEAQHIKETYEHPNLTATPLAGATQADREGQHDEPLSSPPHV